MSSSRPAGARRRRRRPRLGPGDVDRLVRQTFTPRIVRPEQVSRRPRKPYGARLQVEVLRQTLLDLADGHAPGCRGHRPGEILCPQRKDTRLKARTYARDRLHALGWLVGLCEDPACSDDHASDVFSFQNVAAELGVDERRLLAAVLAFDGRGRPKPDSRASWGRE